MHRYTQHQHSIFLPIVMDHTTNVSLQQYNTFGVDCIAADFVTIQNKADVQELAHSWLLADRHFLVIWGGSNLLLTQATYEGVIIKNEIMGIRIEEIDDQYATITVGAGETRDTFVQRSLLNGLSWLENLSGIPWSVGAAPVQNIGAYGVEVQAYITAVIYVDCTTGEEKTVEKNDCEFAYRRSCFKAPAYQQACITHVQFRLPRYHPDTYVPNLAYASLALTWETPPTPKEVAQAILATRANKLPDRHTTGTAGSFFKNPIVTSATFQELIATTPDLKWFPQADWLVKLSAGQLIELVGYKGYKTGNVGTYANHALVLVNYGGGTGQELLDLVHQLQTAVHERFGVILVPEVCII